ncbi:MAG: DNA recombination protein RmuC [Chlamydiota bacterium]
MLISCLACVVTFLFTCYLFLSRKQEKQQMKESFQSLSLDVLQKSQEQLLALSKEVLGRYQLGSEKELAGKTQEVAHLIQPLREALLRFDAYSREIERKREGAYGSLEQQITQLLQSEKELRIEASRLKGALKSPNVRGSWGQIHLRRVVELSGMLRHCDFFEEVQVEGIEGKKYRPDLVVKLPGNREVVVDAKVPLDAYLQAAEEEQPEKKEQKLVEHTQQLKRHIKTLQGKEYWKHFATSPEYVILFLPAEAFFSAALEIDPTILEMGIEQNVILATPTTLVAILKAIAFGWRQQAIAEDAQSIARLGKELYERILTVSEHWNRVGESLGRSVEAYNKATGSLERRVLPSARKLKETSSQKEVALKEVIAPLPKSLLGATSSVGDQSTSNTK